MQYQLNGILKVLKETQPVSEKFKKREFVITDNSSQYPQHISFQLTQDKCSLLDGANEGDTITVHFNIRGREWTNPQGEIKYFNSLEAWKIERSSGSNNGNNEYATNQSNSPVEKDDLPF